MVTGGCYAEDTNPPITPGGILEVGMFPGGNGGKLKS